MTTDVRSPGGWLTLLNSRVSRWLVVGAVAVGGGGGAVAIYGNFQGAQAAFYCEGLIPSTTKNTVAVSCLNPLPNDMSGAILPDAENIIVVNSNTAPATRLNIGTAASATAAVVGTSTAANVGSGITLDGAKRILSLSQTGGLTAQSAHGVAPIVLAPRNDTNGKRFLNLTLQRGSGATVSGEAPAYFRIKIVPCSLANVGC
ncbi:MAG: hypothetical protein JWP89_2631 [Schlesneria sp.]|nr:hypothetical protein [Schlesneria sp.]